MESDKLNIIFYVFIVIFSITAIITFLGITNVIKSISAKYLNALFGALILEVAAAVLLSYKQIDFGCETEEVLVKLTRNIEGLPNDATVEERLIVLESLVLQGENASKNIDELNQNTVLLEEQLSECQETNGTANEEISKLDKVFYSNVIKLRIVSEKFRGRTINLLWDRSGKQEVYQILGEIFRDLGQVGPNDDLSTNFILNTYIKFANASGWDYLLKKNEADEYVQVLVDEYATTLFLRKYLNQKYPLKKM
ncbi:MAG: hypothetical protein ABJF11_15930 [Reichenbachiella sp.]|uniref:hypothetical protein n=1 Tax=Reichenbachiella sp. TaxID=2184521 RepID=UPI0032654B4E